MPSTSARYRDVHYVLGVDLDGDGDQDVLGGGYDKIAWYENQVIPTTVETFDLPEDYYLSPAYPNPFNPSTTFTLTLAQPQYVTVAVFDVLGRQVTVLHEGLLLPAQTHRFAFEVGSLPSGVYIYRVIGEDFTASRRVVFVR